MKSFLLILLLLISIGSIAQEVRDTTLKTLKFCPICIKRDQVIPIVYGKPIPETVKRAERGEVHLGGCRVSATSPKFYCRRDYFKF